MERPVASRVSPTGARPVGAATLPRPATTLVGRGADVAAVTAALAHQGVRLLTLTGPGGVGKTRLAIAVAAALAPGFDAGAAFVGLAALRDPALVAPTIAQTLGLRETRDLPSAAALAAALSDRHLLLVLDNLEQVIGAGPTIADLLAACPRLTILATSRVPLHLLMEHEYAVAPLDLDAAPDGAAVALFVERARAIAPHLRLTDANSTAIVEIVRRLDGLPLAIELAAARMKVLSPEALRARLTGRLELLTGGARDLPARQRTMRDAVAWSHDLLDPDQQLLFRRLAVFASGFTLAAVEAVATERIDEKGLRTETVVPPSSQSSVLSPQSSPVPEVLDTLTVLLDHSLIRRLPGPEDPEDGPRFGMLETVREFALERLLEADEGDAVHRAQTAFLLDLADRAEAAWFGPAQPVWLARLEAERDNVRAAFDWADRAIPADPELLLRLASVALFRQARHVAENRARLERVLAATASAVVPVPVRIHALWTAGLLAELEGDVAAVERRFAEGLVLARQLDDAPWMVRLLFFLGQSALRAGDLGRGEAMTTEALAHGHCANSPYWVAAAVSNLGLAAGLRGDHARAIPLLEDVVDRTRAIGQVWGIATALQYLAGAVLAAGDPDRALTHRRESVARFAELGDTWHVAQGVTDIALILADRLPPDQAVRLLGAADAARDAAIAPLLPTTAQRHERVVANLRARLGDDAFAAAWSAGRAMPHDAVLAEPDADAAAVGAGLAGLPAGLTEREGDILRLLAQGLSNAEIADRLFLSPRTVNTHLTNIFRKLEVNSRAAATRFAYDHDLA